MKSHPMKPETLARRAAKREADRAARRASLLERMAKLAQRDGPDSFWADYYADISAGVRRDG